ncbi:hypothetical protein E4P42_07050 [Mycobacterium sp. PS03-16]|uniref:hypothetical protein n=1 Tax=Mycobacterium sp. PS03-16 TaxID=2559611 RepID=UPI0010736A2C|nr:hypothetical protein [Mycobacterium sp. PS03-16]TFV59652.1 hypothetical protein E4P42_07050 [Mycobacterium sp. PS03-16]
MKNPGPILTLTAVACAGAGIWLANVSHESGAAAPATVAATTAVPAAAEPEVEAPRSFPQQARYLADIPTRNGTLAVDLSVDGDRARAYACDNRGTEVWLRGQVAAGAVHLANTDGTSTLDARLTDAGLNGTLQVADSRWTFSAAPVGSSYGS